MAKSSGNDSRNQLRIVQTARTVDEMNEAVENGFFPLVKRVIPSPEISSWLTVLQSNKTGEVMLHYDLRSSIDWTEFEVVIPNFSYYPHSFNPIATYLIPKDIEIGEKVWLEDLIEDYVGEIYNQDKKFRLESCEGTWNGKDIEINYDPSQQMRRSVG